MNVVDAASAVIVRVAEAEHFLTALRGAFERSTFLDVEVPPHITLLYPFLPPQQITPQVLGKLRTGLMRVQPFSYSFHEARCFPGVAYLAPDPIEPFVALTRSVNRLFPWLEPYRGKYAALVPHLTVAAGEDAFVQAVQLEAQKALLRHGRIHANCNAVEVIENSSGLWRQHSVLPCGE